MSQRRSDEAFERLANGSGPIPNWLGVLTRRTFFTPELNFVTMNPPESVDSEYLEWLDVVESVVSAGDVYAMIELGAGYGRWTVNAVAAVRAFGRSRYRVMAVEAEPTHFGWLREHCRDNGLRRWSRSGTTRLLCAAVSEHEGVVDFAVGNPDSWYGQAVADGSWSPENVTPTRSVRLSRLLEHFQHVDLIHADVQGAELAIMREAADSVDSKVRRVHIGTHGAEVEKGLRELFGQRGWSCVRDYPAGARWETPYGEMHFQDGVQTWVNRLAVNT